MTRRGVFVRSDCVSYLTPEGREAMRAYGITTVIDLRTASEVAGAEDERFPRATSGAARAQGVTYLHRALVADADFERMRPANSMLERYLMMLDHRPHAFRDVFTALAHADGPVVFHCMAGKDRTGLVAALLLDLAGVPRDEIAADFAETDVHLATQYEGWIALASPDRQDALREELRCPPERILSVLDHVAVRWGGVAGYLESAGMAAATIAELDDRLV